MMLIDRPRSPRSPSNWLWVCRKRKPRVTAVQPSVCVCVQESCSPATENTSQTWRQLPACAGNSWAGSQLWAVTKTPTVNASQQAAHWASNLACCSCLPLTTSSVAAQQPQRICRPWCCPPLSTLASWPLQPRTSTSTARSWTHTPTASWQVSDPLGKALTPFLHPPCVLIPFRHASCALVPLLHPFCALVPFLHLSCTLIPFLHFFAPSLPFLIPFLHPGGITRAAWGLQWLMDTLCYVHSMGLCVHRCLATLVSDISCLLRMSPLPALCTLHSHRCPWRRRQLWFCSHAGCAVPAGAVKAHPLWQVCGRGQVQVCGNWMGKGGRQGGNSSEAERSCGRWQGQVGGALLCRMTARLQAATVCGQPLLALGRSRREDCSCSLSFLILHACCVLPDVANARVDKVGTITRVCGCGCV